MRRAPFGFDARSHERHHGWRAALLKLSIAGAVVATIWAILRSWESVLLGSLISLRFLGPALAPELVELVASLWHGLRGLAYREAQGRFYQFKGHRIRVEDDELLPRRWLALADLATALGQPLPVPVLRRRWPEGLCERADGVYLLDDVALAWLGEQRDARAGRLRQWVERDVWHPARGLRASYAAPDGKGAPAGAPVQDSKC